MLEIAAIKYIDIAPVLPIAGQLPEEGGSVGRGDDNAVVLPDPMRLLSRRHLLIKPDGKGGYVLTNISTSNPALLNELPVAPGESRTVAHGDQVRIGGYLLELRISGPRKQEDRSAPAEHLSGAGRPDSLSQRRDRAEPDEADTLQALLSGMEPPAAAPAATGADIDMILDMGGTRALMSDDPLGIASVRETVKLSDLAGDDRQLLRGLDPESRPGELARELIQDPLMENGNPLLKEGTLDPLEIFAGEADQMRNLFGTPDNKGSGFIGNTPTRTVSELHSPLSLNSRDANTYETASAVIGPVPELVAGTGDRRVDRQEAGMAKAESAPQIPEDFLLDDLLGGPPALPSRSDVPEAGASVLEKDGGCGDRPSVPPFQGPPVEPQSSRAPPPVAEAVPDAPESPGPPTRPEPTPAPPVETEAAAEEKADQEAAALYAALLEGLALDTLREHRTLDADFMRKLGTLLRIAIDGTIRLMAARTTVKREVRAHVTVISPERNNPLKFSPDADVALRYLLDREYPGFMSAEEAVQEAFTDLLSHQIGMVSGMRSALSRVLERFDPEMISRNADTRGMIDGLLSVGRKARLWDAYGRYFEETREQAVDRFQEFFGSAFVEAYEGNPRTGAGPERETP
jgi:type VI secretion system FHA domain protein